METKWVVYIVGAALFGIAAVLSGNIARSLFILTALTIQANVGLTIGEWRQSLYVGDSGPTGFAIPLILFPATMLLCWLLLDPKPMRFGSWRTTLPAALIFLASSCTIFYTPERRLVLFNLQLIVYGYLIFLVPLNYVRTREDVRLAYNLLLLTLVIQALVYYVQNALGVTFSLTGEVVVREYNGFKRHGGTVSHSPTGYAIFVGPLILMAISRFLTTTERRVKFWSAVVGSMGLVALVLNRTRAAWIGVALGCLWIVWVAWRRRAIQPGRLATLVASGLLAIPAFIPVVTARLSVNNAADYEERATLMRQAWRIIMDNPVLGVGSGAYGAVLRNYVLPSEWGTAWLYTVHNAYLLYWAENGIAGLLGFVLLLWLGLRQALICTRIKDETTRALALGWGGGLIHIIWELWWDIGLGGSAPWLVWFTFGLVAASARVAIPAAEPVQPRARTFAVQREVWT